MPEAGQQVGLCWVSENVGPFGVWHSFSRASLQEVKIDKKLEPGLRVTVRLNQKQLPGIWKLPRPLQLPGSEPPPVFLSPWCS